MDIKKFFSRQPKMNLNTNISENLGFEQKECVQIPMSDIENNARKFIVKNNNLDTYISSYYQNNINAGIIFGIPSNLYPYFKYSIELVNKFFNDKKSTFKGNKINVDEVLFIKPMIYTETDSQTGRKVFLLPSILTVAF